MEPFERPHRGPGAPSSASSPPHPSPAELPGPGWRGLAARDGPCAIAVAASPERRHRDDLGQRVNRPALTERTVGWPRDEFVGSRVRHSHLLPSPLSRMAERLLAQKYDRHPRRQTDDERTHGHDRAHPGPPVVLYAPGNPRRPSQIRRAGLRRDRRGIPCCHTSILPRQHRRYCSLVHSRDVITAVPNETSLGLTRETAISDYRPGVGHSTPALRSARHRRKRAISQNEPLPAVSQASVPLESAKDTRCDSAKDRTRSPAKML